MPTKTDIQKAQRILDSAAEESRPSLTPVIADCAQRAEICRRAEAAQRAYQQELA